MLIAEVNEKGERQQAINNGFRQLADYIFGNNKAVNSDKSTKIDMTAPVLQQPSQKIAMTAPVIQTPTADRTWQIRFVMPTEYTLKTLPRPNNPNIKIVEQPEFRAVVIRFSGRATDKNINEHLTRLQNYIKQQQLQVTGQPIYAFYNPPWTMPFMRRNEILFKLDNASTENNP